MAAGGQHRCPVQRCPDPAALGHGGQPSGQDCSAAGNPCAGAGAQGTPCHTYSVTGYLTQPAANKNTSAKCKDILLQSTPPVLFAECLPNLRQTPHTPLESIPQSCADPGKIQLSRSMYVDMVPRCCLCLLKAAKHGAEECKHAAATAIQALHQRFDLHERLLDAASPRLSM